MIVYFPVERDDDQDLVLASWLMARFGFSFLWIAWTHKAGNVRARGPFPYEMTVTPDE